MAFFPMTARRSERRLFLPSITSIVALLVMGTGLPGPSLAQAQSPGIGAPAGATFAVENLHIGSGSAQLRIPRLEVQGSSLSQAEITALFDPAQTGQLQQRIARLDAAAIRVPELRFEQTIPAKDGQTLRQTVIYSNLTLDNVKAGKAAAMRVARATAGVSDPNTPVTFEFGAMSASDVDFGAMVDLFVGSGRPQDANARLLYRDFMLDGMTFSGPNDSAIDVGKVRLSAMKMRPLKEPITSMMEAVVAMSKKPGGEPNDEDLTRIFGMYADILRAYEVGTMDIDGITMRGKDDKKRPVTVTVSKIHSEPYASGRSNGLMLQGIDMRVEDGTLKVAELSWKGGDFNPTIDGLTQPRDKPFKAWIAENWRQLIPSLNGYALSGIDIDVADRRRAGQRIKGRLGAFDISLARYVTGIPSDIGLRVKNLALEVPNNPETQGLRALGYDKIDVSFGLAAKWDEPSQTIKVTDLSTDGASMGALAVTATFGNALKDLFSTNPSVMQGAALGLTAKDISLKLDNAGLFERVIEQTAQKQHRSAAEVRRELAASAALMIPTFLGGGESAQAVSSAVAKFFARPKSLSLTAKAKNPGGLGMLDLMMANGNPASLVPKLDITAKAD